MGKVQWESTLSGLGNKVLPTNPCSLVDLSRRLTYGLQVPKILKRFGGKTTVTLTEGLCVKSDKLKG